MANVITDPQQFYKFAAPDIWRDINPELGEHIRIADAVREGLRVYNVAYPPPPPGFASTLGMVILVACCCCVIGAAVLSSAGAVTAGTTATGASASAAASVNTAAATAAASTGSTVAAGSTVSVSQAVAFAGKAASGIGTIAKAVGSATGNTTAQKIGTAADVIAGDVKFTDGVVQLYKQQMLQNNLEVGAAQEAELRQLAYAEQQQYAEYLKKQAAAEQKKAEQPALPAWVLPAAGIVTAIALKG